MLFSYSTIMHHNSQIMAFAILNRFPLPLHANFTNIWSINFWLKVSGTFSKLSLTAKRHAKKAYRL